MGAGGIEGPVNSELVLGHAGEPAVWWLCPQGACGLSGRTQVSGSTRSQLPAWGAGPQAGVRWGALADQPHVSPDKARERAWAGAGAGGTVSGGSAAGQAGLPALSALLACWPGRGVRWGCRGGGGGGFPTSRPSTPLPWGYAKSPGPDVPREGLEPTQPVLCAGPTLEGLKEGPTGPSVGQACGHHPKDPTSPCPADETLAGWWAGRRLGELGPGG